MFVVTAGRVAVGLGQERREFATIEPGGYFGEMSLLTGEPRTATVIARGDTTVLEVDAAALRLLGAADPQAMDRVAHAAVTRRAELNAARVTAVPAAVAGAKETLFARMRKFLGFGQADPTA
jgi:CRP-like cAMP-binding protein